LPHISYDLDGDGFVGGRDYVISKYHDKDGDGKLNAEERKAAEEAVKNVRSCLERGAGWSQKTFPYFTEAWSLC
jgi:hypothetical protein